MLIERKSKLKNMNREIKFRAWHIPTKRMFDVFSWGTDAVFENSIDGVGTLPTLPAERKDCELMEFIGMQDVNEKDIYEGDILQWTSKFRDTDITTPNKRGHVKYNRQGCVYHINYQMQGKHYFKELSATYGGDDCIMETVEIVGNIFETPELLNF